MLWFCIFINVIAYSIIYQLFGVDFYENTMETAYYCGFDSGCGGVAFGVYNVEADECV